MRKHEFKWWVLRYFLKYVTEELALFYEEEEGSRNVVYNGKRLRWQFVAFVNMYA